jgi:predicted transcriptional regulator
MNLNERIKRAGIKKAKLAEKLGVSQAMLSQMLHGTKAMPTRTRRELEQLIEAAEQAFQ